MTNSPVPKPSNNNGEKSLHWHILGGNNKHRIGANAGLCTYEEIDTQGNKKTTTILFDAGSMQADPKNVENALLGDSDTVIPDLRSFLYKKNDSTHVPQTPIDSIFLTHNHSDHLAALPFMLLMGYTLPKVYATPYTAKRLEQELSNAGVPVQDWPDIYTIAPGKPVQEGPVKVTAFWVSHSTPQSVGFFIETPEGNILNPGDFKMDQSVLCGPAFNDDQFRRIVSKPVDLLLLDSTGADKDIDPVTEEDLRDTLREMMEKYPTKRFVVAVMGGFEENLASVARVCAEEERTLWVSGWTHEQSLAAMQDTGKTLQDHIGLPLDVRILGSAKSARDLAAAKPKQSIIVVTGAQGTPHAALTRAAEGKHNALTLDPKNDIVLFCAPSIPGHEGGRYRLFSLLADKKITYFTRQDAPLYPHAHARLPEIIEMAVKAKAKTVVPIHGDAHLRGHCASAMEKIGQRVLSADNGDTLRVTKNDTFSVNPQTKGKPRLTGIKTLQGTGWTDRYYMTIHTSDHTDVSGVTQEQLRKKPRVFNIGK